LGKKNPTIYTSLLLCDDIKKCVFLCHATFSLSTRLMEFLVVCKCLSFLYICMSSAFLTKVDIKVPCYLYTSKLFLFNFSKSRDSSVGVVTRLRAGRSGFDSWQGQLWDFFDFRGGGWELLSSPPRPERFWGPPSLLSNGYQGLFPWGKTAGA
jgi:hypothetical protein